VSNAAPDTTRPTVSISSPAANAAISGTVNVSATASDNVGVVSVQFLVDGLVIGAQDTAAPWVLALVTTSLTNGTHTIAARARDAAGNITTSAAVTVNVNNAVADTTRPTVAITSPAANANLTGTLRVAASATDNVAVLGVQFFVDGAAYGVEDTSAPYEVMWNTAEHANTSHSVTARARDAAGNTTVSAAVSVNVSNSAPLDNVRPNVTLTSPTNGQTVSGTITLAAAATDNVGISSVVFSVDGSALNAEDTTSPYSATLDTTRLTNGQHYVQALARDRAGNSQLAQVSVTVANGTTPGGSTGNFTPVRINSGGDAYTDPSGAVWATEPSDSVGYAYAVSTPVSNTATPRLYQDQRTASSPIVRSFTMPSGNYNVRLLFAELYHSAAGQRTFNVRINGVVVGNNVDVFSRAGGARRAFDLIVPISVTNGRAVVEIIPVIDDAILNGLEITAR
jgi:hypothetical protein